MRGRGQTATPLTSRPRAAPAPLLLPAFFALLCASGATLAQGSAPAQGEAAGPQAATVPSVPADGAPASGAVASPVNDPAAPSAVPAATAAPAGAPAPAPVPAPAAGPLPETASPPASATIPVPPQAAAPSRGDANPAASPAPPALSPSPFSPPAPSAVPGQGPATGDKPEAPPAAAPEAPAPRSGPPVDPRTDTGPIVRPPMQSGDAWIYRRNTGRQSVLMRQEALRVSADGVALRTELAGSPDTSTALYDREWGLLASGYNDYAPALRYYSFPLYAGKRWGINSSISNFGAGQASRVKGEAWAQGWEQVEVGAGRFLALKIEIDMEISDPGNPERQVRVRETHWYARTVLRAVKVESHSVIAGQEPTSELIELVSYRMD